MMRRALLPALVFVVATSAVSAFAQTAGQPPMPPPGGATTGQPATPGQGGKPVATTDSKQNSEQSVVEQAAIDNLAAIQFSQIAIQRAQDPQVRQFAQQMIDEHRHALDQLKQVASASGLNVPSDLDKKHQKVQDKLSKLNGSEFDRHYISAMIDAYKDEEDLLQKQAGRSGAPASAGMSGTTGTATAGTSGTETATATRAAGTSATSLSEWASTALMSVRDHLQQAQDLEKQVKKEPKSGK